MFKGQLYHSILWSYIKFSRCQNTNPGLLGDSSLLRVGDVHDDPPFGHLGKAGLHLKCARLTRLGTIIRPNQVRNMETWHVNIMNLGFLPLTLNFELPAIY